ncbi:306_t:CDS:2 [Cetraspora pellucida]|uniref:306_t:CDS:1 n=1 Tax=Cetraspora pellucida TaxID=1433469 RepID=A0ACA9KJP7_9GLOM|nr:306_t:CDS:2 [Cetraspora pellucida]
MIPWEEIQFKEEIGKGNFGTVNKGYWTKTHEYVACKKITNTKDINDKQSTAFMNELKMHVKLNLCNNIIRFLGVTKDNTNHKYYLIMEFANNGDLYTYIRQKHHFLNWNKRLNLALQIANGLSVLHSEEIIHRDLHDKNILIHNDEAKIADLGHARNDNMETHVHSNLFGATPFLAPELLNNSNNFRNLPYCKQTDIYSLGFLFWELASGRRPALIQLIVKGLSPLSSPLAALMYSCDEAQIYVIMAMIIKL